MLQENKKRKKKKDCSVYSKSSIMYSDGQVWSYEKYLLTESFHHIFFHTSFHMTLNGIDFIFLSGKVNRGLCFNLFLITILSSEVNMHFTL